MVELRPARPEHAAFLCDLTFRSKASHGYDAKMMEYFGDGCGVTPEQIERDTVMLAVEGEAILGYAHLMVVDIPETIYLENLYVEPAAQGQGIGRVLIDWAAKEATARGYRWLEWESDPNAAPFYRKMGGVQISEQESTGIPGRMIPTFRKPLQAEPQSESQVNPPVFD